jgi:hypothetical protein
VSLLRLSEADLAKVVRQRAALCARSDRLKLRTRDQDYDALMRARAACLERGLAGLFHDAYMRGLEDDEQSV